MMEGRTYLASDLAGELGLPRSTINDWLVRYADYLEVDTRGKRKVYSAKSLRILKEISEMRNEGKSSFEIEQLLASRYGIRPEVAPPAPQGPEQQPGASSETLPAPQEGGLPALRPAFEQMTVQINTEFLKLANQLEEAERYRKRLVQRMWAVTAGLIVALAVLVLVLALIMYQVFGRIEKKNRETAETLSRESGEKLGELGVVLDSSRQDFNENIAKLKEEMAAQRRSFEEKLKELEANSATRAEAQIIKFKEEFARRQQEELKRLEGLQQTVRETAKSQLDAVKEEMRRQEAARLEAEKAAAAKKEAEARLNQPKETQKQEQKPAPSKEVPKQEQQKPAPIQAPASTQKPETVK